MEAGRPAGDSGGPPEVNEAACHEPSCSSRAHLPLTMRDGDCGVPKLLSLQPLPRLHGWPFGSYCSSHIVNVAMLHCIGLQA
jgi:hypothetical protein